MMTNKEILKRAKEVGLGQIDSEWINFINFLNTSKPQTIMEIGTNKGGSSYTLAHFAKHLICVDIKDICQAKEKIKDLCTFDFIVGDSKSEAVIAKVNSILNGKKLDLLFIDGDHSYDGTKTDFENFGKLVKSGGHIAFHDIVKSANHIRKNCLVFKLWEEIKSTHSGTVEYKSGAEWAGIGIVKV